jgi:DivIVA domain-containing protein
VSPLRLTARELKAQEFARRMRGYDPEEVDRFLGLVADDLEGLEGECERLAHRVAELDEQVGEYHDMERSLRDALILASEAGERAQQRAEAVLAEAEAKKLSIVREGEQCCREILGEAESKRRELLLEVEGLQSRRSYLLSRLRSLVDDQRAVLEANDASSGRDAPSLGRVVSIAPAKSGAAVGEDLSR